MRMKLRWKILTFTVLPLMTLALAALWIVNHSVSSQLYANIHEDLRRAAAVLENLLAARGRELTVAGQVIAQDPKFFSVLTIPGNANDPQVRATVSGVARDFNSITEADLFEVVNSKGQLIASVGRDASDEKSRFQLIDKTLAGRPIAGLLVQPGAHFQVAAMPVIAGGRVVGALLLGSRIGRELAEHLRSLTRSEVTFVSHQTTTGSTLERREDLSATLEALDQATRTGGSGTAQGTMLQVRGGLHRFLTLAGTLPESVPDQRQYFVMQRAVDAETAFLRGIQTQLTELGILAVLAALLTGFVIAERITSPVRRLVRGAEEMERGNYDYPLEVKARDEIGYLAMRFQDMRQRQRAYVTSLEEVARLKSEFISVASHELRTPITVIKGYQELMIQGTMGSVNPHQVQALDAMGRSIGSLQRIAEDATRMSQVESERLVLTLDEHAVGSLIDQAMKAALELAEGRRVQMRRHVEPGLEPIRVDGPRVSQAVANLLTNGIRFTPDGGTVEIRARRDDEDLVIEVRDTGVGIPPDRQKHVFERLSVVRDSLHHHSSSTLAFNSAGLGLGLSIARGIVEAHGGTLRLESAVGRGSTFTIRIPIRQDQNEMAA